jgi:hypothetical protein
MNMDIKYIALQLCTCTWIEIMTGAGITLYMLYLQSYMLAALALALFAPLIVFHFVLTKMSKLEDCDSIRCRLKYSSYSDKTAANI